MLTWGLKACKCGHGRGSHVQPQYRTMEMKTRRMVEGNIYANCSACHCPEFCQVSRGYKHIFLIYPTPA